MMLKLENTEYNLGARILSGEATPEEVTLHEKWLAADPLNSQEWEEMVNTWNVASDAVRFSEVNANDAWKKVKKQIKPAEKAVWYTLPVFQGVAAAVLLALSVAALWLWLKPGNLIEYRHVTVLSTYGEDVVLPDGSVVSLNAGSSITYTDPFTPELRLVNFSGEAFFQVEGNPEKPFVIETNYITVKVVGTSFNVRSWPNQNASYVDVSTGTVEVSVKSDINSMPVSIKSGNRAVYNRSNGILEKTPGDPNFLAWKTRQIEFQNAPLSQVFETLENVYRVKIQVSDASILNERMGATFSHNTLDYISGVVCSTFSLECTSEKGTLYFSRKKK